MTTANIIRELNHLPLTDKLLVIEQTLKSIRKEKKSGLKHGVDAMYDEYKSNKELRIFTILDKEEFYEAR